MEAWKESLPTHKKTGLQFPNQVSIKGGAEDATTPVLGVLPQSNNFAITLPAPVGTGKGGALGFVFLCLRGNEAAGRLPSRWGHRLRGSPPPSTAPSRERAPEGPPTNHPQSWSGKKKVRKNVKTLDQRKI